MSNQLQPPRARVAGSGTVRADGSVKHDDTPKPTEERNDGTVPRRSDPNRSL